MGSGVGVKSETPETDRFILSGTEFKIYRGVLHGVNIVTKYQSCDKWLII
jgi:hypothetical protein